MQTAPQTTPTLPKPRECGSHEIPMRLPRDLARRRSRSTFQVFARVSVSRTSPTPMLCVLITTLVFLPTCPHLPRPKPAKMKIFRDQRIPSSTPALLRRRRHNINHHNINHHNTNNINTNCLGARAARTTIRSDQTMILCARPSSIIPTATLKTHPAIRPS